MKSMNQARPEFDTVSEPPSHEETVKSLAKVRADNDRLTRLLAMAEDRGVPRSPLWLWYGGFYSAMCITLGFHTWDSPSTARAVSCGLFFIVGIGLTFRGLSSKTVKRRG